MNRIIRVKCLRCSGAHGLLGFVPGATYWGETDGDTLRLLGFDGSRSHEVLVLHKKDGVYGSKQLCFRDTTDNVDDAEHDREQVMFALASIKRMLSRVWHKVTGL